MTLPPPIKGLVFDCDGTLADTMPLHWRAWQVITARYKLHFPEDRFYSLGGVPSRDILQMLAREQGVTLDHIQAQVMQCLGRRFQIAADLLFGEQVITTLIPVALATDSVETETFAFDAFAPVRALFDSDLFHPRRPHNRRN